MKSLWSDFVRVEENVGRGRKLFLFLDFDGTLSPLANRPARARLSSSLRRTLRRLGERTEVSVAVVSGRSLPDVRRRVGLRALYYGGNHGLEMVGPGFRFRHPNAERSGSDLLEVARSLARLAQAVPGVEWEDKKLGVALHYRRVPRRCLPRLRGLIRRMRRAGTKNRLHWTNGKKVVELRPPVAWNKGNAADLLWRRSGRPFPLVIGDDETDEDMFLAFRGKGITVCVGRKPKSGAEYFVAGPEHVHRLLKQLLGLLEKR